jgi:hypothetical protein
MGGAPVSECRRYHLADARLRGEAVPGGWGQDSILNDCSIILLTLQGGIGQDWPITGEFS